MWSVYIYMSLKVIDLENLKKNNFTGSFDDTLRQKERNE
jgi:hypothetical protein